VFVFKGAECTAMLNDIFETVGAIKIPSVEREKEKEAENSVLGKIYN
jgi:hypothetical protein